MIHRLCVFRNILSLQTINFTSRLQTCLLCCFSFLTLHVNRRFALTKGANDTDDCYLKICRTTLRRAS